MEQGYDAAGIRVAKGSLPSLSCGAPTSANSFTLNNQYLLDLGGDQGTGLLLKSPLPATSATASPNPG